MNNNQIAEKFQFQSKNIANVLLAEVADDGENFVKFVEAEIRRAIPGWSTETVAESGAKKALKQPKHTQKTGWNETPTVTIGIGMKRVVPSNGHGQIYLADAAFALMEKHGIAVDIVARPESMLEAGIKKLADQFKATRAKPEVVG